MAAPPTQSGWKKASTSHTYCEVSCTDMHCLISFLPLGSRKHTSDSQWQLSCQHGVGEHQSWEARQVRGYLHSVRILRERVWICTVHTGHFLNAVGTERYSEPHFKIQNLFFLDHLCWVKLTGPDFKTEQSRPGGFFWEKTHEQQDEVLKTNLRDSQALRIHADFLYLYWFTLPYSPVLQQWLPETSPSPHRIYGTQSQSQIFFVVLSKSVSLSYSGTSLDLMDLIFALICRSCRALLRQLWAWFYFDIRLHHK